MFEFTSDNKDARLYYQRARAAYGVGNYSEAEELLTALAKVEPVPAVYYELGQTYLALGRREEGERCFRRCINASPDPESAALQVAAMYLERGMTDAAVKTYLALLQKQPLNFTAHYNLAWALENGGRPEQAERHFRRAVLLQPDDPVVRQGLANCLYGMRDFRRCIPHYRKILLADPENLESLFFLGQALKGIKEYQEALAHFEKALSLAPEEPDLWTELGNTQALLGSHEAALKSYVKAAELNTDSTLLLADLAKLYLDAGDPVHAGIAAEELRRSRPNDEKALAAYAELELRAGHFAEAALAYKRLSKMDPENTRYLMYWAESLAGEGQVAEAEKLYQKSLDLDRGDAKILLSYAETLRSAGNSDRSVDLYREAAELSASSVAAYRGLAAAYIDLGKLEEAKSALETARELDPLDKGVRALIARALELMGDAEGAAAMRRSEASQAEAESVAPFESDASPDWPGLAAISAHAESRIVQPQIFEYRFDLGPDIYAVRIYEDWERGIWHYVTAGLSDLESKTTKDPELSRFGFELTMQLPQRAGEASPPLWPARLCGSLALHLERSGETFAHGDHILFSPEVDCGANAFAGAVFRYDTRLGSFQTGFGRVAFIQAVPLTRSELASFVGWQPQAMIEILQDLNPDLAFPVERSHLFQRKSIAQRISEGMAREGSAIERLAVDSIERIGGEGLALEVTGLPAEWLEPWFRGRLQFGRPLEICAIRSSLRFVPSFRTAMAESDGSFLVEVDEAGARGILAGLAEGKLALAGLQVSFKASAKPESIQSET